MSLALVLSGGGARASYQVGVLAAIAERAPDLRIPLLTGVSAGAINAVFLAAHQGPFQQAVGDLRREWLRITPDRVYRVATTSMARVALSVLLGTSRGLEGIPDIMDTAPLRRLLQAMIDFRGIDANLSAGRLAAVALTATSYATGQTVTFIHGDPHVTIWERAQRTAAHARLTLDHVMASSAIPFVFPAVEIDGRFYGDGSVRQTAPLAPAVHLGGERLLVIGMRPSGPGRAAPPGAKPPSTAQVVALLFDSVFLDALDADAERLELINRLLATLPPPAPTARLRPVTLLMLRPSRPLSELAAGLHPRLPRPFHRLVRTIGGAGSGAGDFLSYLLFDPSYTGLTMELGYHDTLADWGRIAPFLQR